MTCEAFTLESTSGTAALDTLNIVLGVLSCLACLVVFWGFFRNSNKSLYDASSMIVMLALSDTCLAMISILEGCYPAYKACDSQANVSMCAIKACIGQFFGMSSFLWSAAMAHSSYGQISRLFTITPYLSQSAQGSLVNSSMFFYHIICWGVPLVSLIVVITTRSAGPSSSHLCWVTVDRSGSNDSELPLYAGLLLFVLPLVLVECYLLWTFRWLARIIRQMPSESTQQLLQRVYTLLAVIVGLKFVFLGTRTIRMLYPENNSFILGMLVIIGAPLQGLGDFYIFRANPANTSSSDRTASGTISASLDSARGNHIEMRKGYSTVHNPLSAGEDGDIEDTQLRNSSLSAIGLIGAAEEAESIEFGNYATLVGDSAHNSSAMNSRTSVSDDFDEVIFDDASLPLPKNESRRSSAVGLLESDR
jgi:hypothetical protein